MVNNLLGELFIYIVGRPLKFSILCVLFAFYITILSTFVVDFWTHRVHIFKSDFVGNLFGSFYLRILSFRSHSSDLLKLSFETLLKIKLLRISNKIIYFLHNVYRILLFYDFYSHRFKKYFAKPKAVSRETYYVKFNVVYVCSVILFQKMKKKLSADCMITNFQSI